MKFKHFSKFEIAGIGSLKGVHVAAYGLSLMSLHQMLSKYWGFIFIFKKKPGKVIVDIQNILESYRMRSLIVKGKITIIIIILIKS